MTTRRFAWLRRLWSLSTGRFGLIVVLLIGLTALVARFWTPFANASRYRPSCSHV